MDTLQLELFNSVAQTQSLTKSAELFNITQPAVSHNLKKLEKTYGVKLFERNNRGIVLTEAGREFLPFVRSILGTMADAENRMQNIATGRVGHIRIAAIPATLNFLSNCIRIMHDKMPSVQIDLDIYEGPDLVVYMALNSYDYFFTTSAQLDSLTGYGHAFIGKDSLDLFVGKCNLDKIDISNWADCLKDIPFVSVPMSDAQLALPVLTILEQHSVKSNFINYYNRVESVLLAVSVGIGISILPRSLKDSYRCKDIETFAIEGGENCLDYVFSWNTKKNDNPVNKMFTDTVLEYFNCQPSPADI